MPSEQPSRRRKAWAVRTTSHEPNTPPDILYAPTRSKARAAIIINMRDAWDCSFMEAAREIISITRAPGQDVQLPDRHPQAHQLDSELLSCITHAYGGTDRKAGYRDHFYTSITDDRLLRLEAMGVFTRGRELPATTHGGGTPHAYFLLTSLGKRIAAGEVRTYADA
jgi:hypothetical protein